MASKILIIEDEPDVVDMIELGLHGAGLKTISAADGEAGLRKAREESPDLLILDLMIPKLSGLEVCKNLRKDPATSSLPIIMLTAKADEVDRIVGLELGADDYVTKPFSPRELVLRVKSILRRASQTDEKAERLSIGDLAVDLARHEVLVQGKKIILTATE
ncbi:MAG: response regulator, partial [Verrucomicrobiota bacterium]